MKAVYPGEAALRRGGAVAAGRPCAREGDGLCAMWQSVNADARRCPPFSDEKAARRGRPGRSMGSFATSVPWKWRSMGWIFRSVGCFGWRKGSDLCRIVAKNAFSGFCQVADWVYVAHCQELPIFAHGWAWSGGAGKIAFSVLKNRPCAAFSRRWGGMVRAGVGRRFATDRAKKAPHPWAGAGRMAVGGCAGGHSFAASAEASRVAISSARAASSVFRRAIFRSISSTRLPPRADFVVTNERFVS